MRSTGSLQSVASLCICSLQLCMRLLLASSKAEMQFNKAASELTALAAAMTRSARLPMLQCRRALPTAIAVAKVDHSDTA